MGYLPCQEIAAVMFGGDRNSAGLLNISLSQELVQAASFVKASGGVLRSRQVIAAIIVNWIWRNPDEQPYFPEG